MLIAVTHADKGGFLTASKPKKIKMYFLLLTTVWHYASGKVTSFLIVLPPGVALSALQHDVRHSPTRRSSLFWHLDLMMNLIRDTAITRTHQGRKEIFLRNQEIPQMR